MAQLLETFTDPAIWGILAGCVILLIITGLFQIWTAIVQSDPLSLMVSGQKGTPKQVNHKNKIRKKKENVKQCRKNSCNLNMPYDRQLLLSSRHTSRRSSCCRYKGKVSMSPKKYKQGQINYEEEFQMPYVQAYKSLFTETSDEKIRQAMRYMKEKGTFGKKSSKVLGKTLEHIECMVKSVAAGYMKQLAGREFPEELERKELTEKLLDMNLWSEHEIPFILDEHFSLYGFYPVPTEFCKIYDLRKGNIDEQDKSLCAQKMEIKDMKKIIGEQQRKIESIIGAQQRKLEEIIGEHQRESAYLKQRIMCKICSVEEIETMVYPCRHVYSCRGCISTAGQNRACFICGRKVEKYETVYLS